jgi:hypothetical protein
MRQGYFTIFLYTLLYFIHKSFIHKNLRQHSIHYIVTLGVCPLQNFPKPLWLLNLGQNLRAGFVVSAYTPYTYVKRAVNSKKPLPVAQQRPLARITTKRKD